MIGLYFSGTGNTKYCVERFTKQCSTSAQSLSIENPAALPQIQKHKALVIGYPVQFSNIPKILQDYITTHSDLWRGTKIFIIATMGLFSGDGAGILARLLHQYGAKIIGGLHLKMPDSISDEKALKRSFPKNQQLIRLADLKIQTAVQNLKNGAPTQEGLGFFPHLAGLFGQRLYFYNKTKHYSNKLKINASKCIRCGKCVKLCPMQNIHFDSTQKQVAADAQCTMCYRCVSQCPTQAITLLGKRVVEQCYLEKYLRNC